MEEKIQQATEYTQDQTNRSFFFEKEMMHPRLKKVLDEEEREGSVFPALSTNSTSPKAFFRQMPEKPLVQKLRH